MTRQSYFRRRCARRRVTHRTICSFRARITRRRGSPLPHQWICDPPALHSKCEFTPACAATTCRSLEAPRGTSRNRHLLALRHGAADGPHRPQTKPLISQADPSAPRRSRMAPTAPNEAPDFPGRPIRAEAKPTAPPPPNEAHGFPGRRVRAEAKPMAPTAAKRSPWFPRQTHPRRGGADGPNRPQNEAPGFPCGPVRDARSAEWELMSPLSLTRSVRGHGF